MPLPPILPNATARVYVDYTSYSIGHTIMFRLGAGSSPTLAAGKAQALANVLSQRMSLNDSFSAARYSAMGSDFSLPITFPPVAGVIDPTAGAPLWEEDPESAFISFVGRGGTTSRRTRWEFFTSIRTPEWPLTNRYNAGSSGPVDTLRINFAAWVNDSDVPGEQVVTVGGDIPVVYGYVNIAKNSYWQRKQR